MRPPSTGTWPLHTDAYPSATSPTATKPGSLLKRQIPIRAGTEWEEQQPGFVEVDLVAHRGDSAAGEFIYTLDVVDIFTGWNECVAVPNRGQRAVFAAVLTARQRLPFPLRGIDSDNGSEFINHHLYRYCQREDIASTRGWFYRKNDQAHEEQKNWSVVRRQWAMTATSLPRSGHRTRSRPRTTPRCG